MGSPSLCKKHPNKVAYKTKAKANKARIRQQSKHRNQNKLKLVTYQCGEHWHLGRPRHADPIYKRMYRELTPQELK